MLTTPDLALDDHTFTNDRNASRLRDGSASGAPKRSFFHCRLRFARGRSCSSRIFLLFTIAPHVHYRLQDRGAPNRTGACVGDSAYRDCR